MTVIYPRRVRLICCWIALATGPSAIGFFGANAILYHGRVSDIALAAIGCLIWAIGANALYREPVRE